MAEDQAYHKTGREGLSAREREQQQQETEFGNTAAGRRIQELEKTVETMWRWISGFKGQSGIRTVGNIVELENPQALGGGTPESGGNSIIAYIIIEDGSGARAVRAKIGNVQILAE